MPYVLVIFIPIWFCQSNEIPSRFAETLLYGNESAHWVKETDTHSAAFQSDDWTSRPIICLDDILTFIRYHPRVDSASCSASNIIIIGS